MLQSILKGALSGIEFACVKPLVKDICRLFRAQLNSFLVEVQLDFRAV